VYLGVFAIYSSAVKGLSALQLTRDMGVQYKIALILAHKIHESLMDQPDDALLAGCSYGWGLCERPYPAQEQEGKPYRPTFSLNAVKLLGR
jgi:hypothetical protein